MGKIYFRKTQIPELSSYSHSKKIAILRSLEPHWMEVVSFFGGIALAMFLTNKLAAYIYLSTGKQWVAIMLGGSIVPLFYFCYEFVLLNFITRRKVSAKLGN